MKLTKYTDLSLRLLMYLSMRLDEPVTIQEVSERFAISKNHLVKISHQLTKAGLITSTRGRNGGVCLARSPETITVEEVVRATEDNFDLVECFGEAKNQCVISGACGLTGVLLRARAAFFEVLRQVSLGDLVKDGRMLEESLLPLHDNLRTAKHRTHILRAAKGVE